MALGLWGWHHGMHQHPPPLVRTRWMNPRRGLRRTRRGFLLSRPTFYPPMAYNTQGVSLLSGGALPCRSLSVVRWLVPLDSVACLAEAPPAPRMLLVVIPDAPVVLTVGHRLPLVLASGPSDLPVPARVPHLHCLGVPAGGPVVSGAAGVVVRVVGCRCAALRDSVPPVGWAHAAVGRRLSDAPPLGLLGHDFSSASTAA